ncbi:hypothetical protein [Sandaracinus amylolyticus]|uniref:hypothetical protein n=1 Tax=Sandaracinus amylolyticus TaxID=927083 RepID=UPI001F38E815|nr:hypothetical protein [Sandaracinus amylolyticus]UJR83829.1 Hypothetical protein I5071_59000 [Sandaracinus amylolyticus]
MPESPRDEIIFSPASPTPKEALDRKRELLASVQPSELPSVLGLEPSAAAGIVMGSLPRIAKHRAAIGAQFGEDGLAIIDDLLVVAHAAVQADVELTASDSASDMAEPFAELAQDHKLLLTDCDSLANRKLLDPARVDLGRPLQGYRTVITSTLVLVALLRESWATVRGKTPLTVEDIDRAERRATGLLHRLNAREQGSTRLPAADIRARALGLLVKTYGEARRMLSYVRWWEGDADTIAPSLWSGRRRSTGSRGTDTPPAGEDTQPATPIVPIPTPGPIGDGPFTE